MLAYVRSADNAARFTISREKHVQVDGKYVDAVLGNFLPAQEEFIVAPEGKGPLDPLDRPFAGRKMSANVGSDPFRQFQQGGMATVNRPQFRDSEKNNCVPVPPSLTVLFTTETRLIIFTD